MFFLPAGRWAYICHVCVSLETPRPNSRPHFLKRSLVCSIWSTLHNGCWICLCLCLCFCLFHSQCIWALSYMDISTFQSGRILHLHLIETCRLSKLFPFSLVWTPPPNNTHHHGSHCYPDTRILTKQNPVISAIFVCLCLVWLHLDVITGTCRWPLSLRCRWTLYSACLRLSRPGQKGATFTVVFCGPDFTRW